MAKTIKRDIRIGKAPAPITVNLSSLAATINKKDGGTDAHYQ